MSLVRKDILLWSLQMYDHSRKPHRAQPDCTQVAEDLASILLLAKRRHDIASRYEASTQLITDEDVENQIIGKLEAIGKKYGWHYGSTDGGITGLYVIVHAALHTEITIPLIEDTTTTNPRSA